MSERHIFPAVLIRKNRTSIAKSYGGVMDAQAWGEAWTYLDCLHDAYHVIHDDETLGSEDRRRLLIEAVSEFNACMASALGLVDLEAAAGLSATVQAAVLADLEAQMQEEQEARRDAWEVVDATR